MKRFRYGLVVLLGLVAISAIMGVAWAADCSDPDGFKGTVVYNDSYQTLQFCNGTTWIAMGSGSSGCPVGGHGTGYFVITNGTWDGDLEQEAIDAGLSPSGGPDGADKLCLKDLTDNDWMGKADAQARGLLNASTVKAWLGWKNAGISANNASANTEYFFAVSGDATKGGASFTADASGLGPGNNADWSAASYFSGTKQYWTGRSLSDSTNLLWSEDGSGVNTEVCGSAGSWIGDASGQAGISNTTDIQRYANGTISCSTVLHLVCFVHP